MAGNNMNEDRREYRRKRRVRNQIISMISVFIVLGGLIAGAVFGVSLLLEKLNEQKQAKELAQELEEKTQQQNAVVEPPVSAETEVNTENEEEVDWLEEMVTTVLSEMPIEDRVAGLFMVTPEQLTDVDVAIQAGDGTKDALNKNAVGGLIYFTKNIKDRDQITQMLSSTASMSKYPLFLAVDEEGGSVSRVTEAGIDVEQVGDMSEIGAAGDSNAAYVAGNTIGSYLSELGFNLDFAPVADVVNDPAKSPIGKRSFGTDPQMVGDMVSSAVNGLQDSGVSACLKHFPGIGNTTKDTHEGMAVIEKTMEELAAEEFLPFKAGIAAGVHMVMVGHVSVPSITGDNTPASLTEKIATELLRNEFDYQGIIITDAMNMSAITEYYTSAEAAVLALKAGADMILMPENYQEAYEGVLAAVKDGTIAEERINESLKRIYRIKFRDRVAQEATDQPAEGEETAVDQGTEDTQTQDTEDTQN